MNEEKDTGALERVREARQSTTPPASLTLPSTDLTDVSDAGAAGNPDGVAQGASPGRQPREECLL